MSAARAKPAEPLYDGPRRADGQAPPHGNGYLWPLAGDGFKLMGRHSSVDWQFGLIHLDTGRWVSGGYCGHVTRDPQFDTRQAAMRHAAAELLRRVRRKLRAGQDTPLFYKIGASQAAVVTAWLFDVLCRELGPKRRWRWRRALGRAFSRRETAAWRLKLVQMGAKEDAHRRAGEWPRKGKKTQAAWEQRLEAETSAALARRAEPLAAAALQLSRWNARLDLVESLRR